VITIEKVNTTIPEVKKNETIVPKVEEPKQVPKV
jgi:hypothetical protein